MFCLPLSMQKTSRRHSILLCVYYCYKIIQDSLKANDEKKTLQDKSISLLGSIHPAFRKVLCSGYENACRVNNVPSTIDTGSSFLEEKIVSWIKQLLSVLLMCTIGSFLSESFAKLRKQQFYNSFLRRSLT